jgi:hypothetical protein
MIKTILMGGGAATRRQIAAAFLAADLSQLEYYEEITKGYPTQTPEAPWDRRSPSRRLSPGQNLSRLERVGARIFDCTLRRQSRRLRCTTTRRHMAPPSSEFRPNSWDAPLRSA